MTNEQVIMAVTYYAPNRTTYARARGVIPDLSRANSRDEVAAVLIEHLVHESEQRRHWQAKAEALATEVLTLKGVTPVDATRAIFTKPPRVAERKPAWHRAPVSVKE
ncbi:hypothetical protein BLJ79_12250 [Arthrobacter sp. UCD-GKA]|uniref:hypothetical protein n=1 Tax=Arthrobacter sp. UCD-GKA TaxID=1913576 RepID=UPI0008DC6BB5|nr:hypothetical protein [Arthrobacter sp. UCD-GKA]OIH84232.1 hypothetical protein BLJ79_12250 [Arthrobacter sp. UCD-GKA]